MRDEQESKHLLLGPIGGEETTEAQMVRLRGHDGPRRLVDRKQDLWFPTKYVYKQDSRSWGGSNLDRTVRIDEGIVLHVTSKNH